MLGPSAGAAVRAVAIEPSRSSGLSNDPANGGALVPDAMFAIDRDLAPGATAEFRLTIVHRPDGCGFAGGALSFEDVPWVEVSSLGVSGERRPAGPELVFRSETDLNECSGN